MMAARQVADALDGDVGREDEVRRGDQALRQLLGALGAAASAREQPDDHEPGERLDQAVRAEADQRDGAGRDSGAERDPELAEVPGVAAPGQRLRLALELRPLAGRLASDRPDLDKLLS